MFRSLRVRLALISMFVSGLAIAGLGIVSWQLMMRAVRESTDVRLEGIAGRLIRDVNPWSDAATMEELFDAMHREEIAGGRLALSAWDFHEEKEKIGSSGWNETMEADLPAAFPVPDPDPVRRPDPRRGGPPGRPRPDGRGPEGRGPDGPGPGPGRPEPQRLEDLFEPPPGETEPLDEPPPEGPGAVGTAPHGKRLIEYTDAVIEGETWRFIAVQERGFGILAGLHFAKANPGLAELRNGFLLGAPLGILLVGFGGWLVAERAMRPLRRISESARRISAEALDARMPHDPHSDPEIEKLTAVLNAMMGRLEAAFAHANRFSADVSHELKTPVAVMQAEIETALRECEAGGREESALLVLRGELGRLKSIIASLLLLSRADVGHLIQKRDPIALSEELEAIAEDAGILCDQAGVSFSSLIVPDLQVSGDAVLLRQALLNLLGNGVKFNTEEGYVRMIANRAGDHVRIAVENSGTGIAEEDREKIFDRFFRGDRSRSREVDGFGLGLSLAKVIIEGHGGSLALEAGTPEMTRFVVLLPFG
ncbi:MAG: HAMP domain-containing protein [Verrucomicrobiales bacterium]|nr:HAMP domain-containing protein [Verrucomicrobiales bacterium]